LSCIRAALVCLVLILSQAVSYAQQTPLVWHDDYLAANERAAAEGKLTLVWFYDRRSAAANASFESKVLEQPEIVALIQRHCVAVKLPTDAAILSDGKEKKLLDLEAFGEMQHQPGIALVDLSDPQSPLFYHVVSVYPFQREWITAEKLAVMLELPRGTLTQRTLIFAVRTHPEHPASAASHLSPLLAKETEKHADLQARAAGSRTTPGASLTMQACGWRSAHHSAGGCNARPA
jgi:hypothetical protein